MNFFREVVAEEPAGGTTTNIHTYINTYIHTYILKYTVALHLLDRKFTYILNIYAFFQRCMHTSSYRYTYRDMHTYMRKYIHTYIVQTYTIHLLGQTPLCTHISSIVREVTAIADTLRARRQKVLVFTYVRTYAVCMYVCTYLYVRMYVCTSAPTF